MPDVRFDTYYRSEDSTRILRGYAEEYLSLVRLEGLGQSYEGRDIWLVTVRNSGCQARSRSSEVGDYGRSISRIGVARHGRGH
jgi:hypothetical protein